MTDDPRDPVTGEAITDEDVERLRREAHEFLETYRATPPARRHTRGERFSGEFGVDGEGDVDVVDEG